MHTKNGAWLPMTTLALTLVATLPGVLAAGCVSDTSGDHNNNNLYSCGDGLVATWEVCDGANLNGQTCASIGQNFTGGILACNSICSGWNTAGCTVSSLCDNGQIDVGEVCDGANLNGQTCTSIGQGFTGGSLACNGTCTGWVTSGCTVSSQCGNGQIDTGEMCDGANLNGQTCTSIGQGFTGGSLACNGTCTGWITSGCTTTGGWTCDQSYYGTGDGCDCGCGLLDPDCPSSSSSECEYCNEYGSCAEYDSDCANIDPSNNAICVVAQCGDALVQGAEVCDGTNLDGQSCISIGQGFTGGSLSCDGTCTGWVTTGCTGTGGWTCSAGYYGTSDGCDCGCGLLDPDCPSGSSSDCDYCNDLGSCAENESDCATINPSNNAVCAAVQCGDGVMQGAEVCDGTDLGGETCATQGFITGTLACAATCDALVTSGCSGTPVCGNGIIEGTETCDGSSNLGGQTCTSLGFEGGTLACGLGCNFSTFDCMRWTCDPSYYGDLSCDCGCGVVDPDCYDDTSTSCTYCNNPGSCDPYGIDCTQIAPTDNAVCQPSSCGDGTAEGKEQCDGADLRAETCTSLGFPTGALGCQASCLYDLSGCGASTCGNATIEGFEECEGTDLGSLAGALCTDLGFTGGSAPTCASCRIDLSPCTGAPAGWTCFPAYYGADDGCDCGCGVTDPDCLGNSAASCDWCSGIGSCGDPMPLSCPGTIDAMDNSACQ